MRIWDEPKPDMISIEPQLIVKEQHCMRIWDEPKPDFEDSKLNIPDKDKEQRSFIMSNFEYYKVFYATKSNSK